MDTNKEFKILVVDDTPEILLITTRILKKENYHVFSAANGAECLEVLKNEKPDLILLDVILPDANGKELAKSIKGNPQFSSVFIILLSSLKTSSENITDGLNEGADGYIIRPVNAQELLARVASAFRIIKAEKELIKYKDHLEELVEERTVELKKKNENLEKLLSAFVDRELKMKELKDKIKALEGKE